MAALLAASTLAGFAYNSFTPLGVRFTQSTETSSKQETPPVSPPVETVSAANTNFVAMPEGAGPMPTPKYPIPAINWAKLKPLLAEKKVTLVDARSRLSYGPEHIPGAICLPSGSNFDMTNFAENRPKDEAIVVYCSSEHCPLSWLVACDLINKFEFTNVKIFPGGFEEYRRQEPNAGKEQAK